MEHQNDRPHPFSHPIRKASSSSLLSSESNKMYLLRFQKKDHRLSSSTSGSDQMDIERDNRVGGVSTTSNDRLDLNSAKLIRSDKSNQWATTNTTTPTKTTSSSSRRLFLQQKTSNSSFSNSSSSGSPPMFNRTPLKSLTNFPLNVKEKTKAFTKSMTEVVSKSSHSFFANLHMTPKVTECTSTYDDVDDDEDEDIPTDCDSGNYNDEIEEGEEAEDEDSEDEGETTFDTINIGSPVMHRKTNSIQMNQQQESHDHDTLLRLPTRAMPRPPITNRPKTIRRIHSVCETQREIDNFQIHEDNSQLKHTNIQTFTLGNDVLPRINEDQLYKILCGEHKHEFDEFIIVDCRFDYEYHGGHIINAMNISTKEALENVFIKQSHQKGSSPTSKKKLLIFHCEFSIFRGPTMAKHLRKCDRMLNQNSYPFLSWPDVVILEGGYKNFFTKYKAFCYPQNYVEMKDIKHEVSCEANLSRVRKDSKLLTRAKSFNQFGGGGENLTNSTASRPSALASASISDFWSMSSHSRSLSSNSFTTLNSGKVIKRQRSNSKVKSISTNLNTKLTRANTFTFDQPIFNSHNHNQSSSSSIASSSSPSSSPLFNNFDFSEEVDKENPLHLQQHSQQLPQHQHQHQQLPQHQNQHQHQHQHQLRSFLPPSTSFRNSHHQQHHKAQLSLSLLLLLLYRHRRSFSSNLSNFSNFSNYSSSSISIHSSASSIVSENISLSTDSLNDPYLGSEMFSPPPGATEVTGAAASSMTLDYFDGKRLSSASMSSLPAVPPSMLRPASRKPSSLQTSLAALAPSPASTSVVLTSQQQASLPSPSRSPFPQPSSSFQFPPRQKKSMSTTSVPTLASPTVSSPLNSRLSRARTRTRARDERAGSINSTTNTNLQQSPNWLSSTASSLKSNTVSSFTPFSSQIDYEEAENDDPINDTPVDFNVSAEHEQHQLITSRATQHQSYQGTKRHHYHQLASRSGLSTSPGDHHARTSSSGNNSNDTIVLGCLDGNTTGDGGYVYSVDDINEDDEEDL